MTGLHYHPLANLFPMMGDVDFENLCASLRQHGFDRSDPIVRHDGRILDGRNRQRGCDSEGVTPVYRDFDPATEGDPLDFVIRRNLPRRHLNETQRAMVAADLANLRNLTQQKAAKILNVSPRSVFDAAKVMAEAAKPVVKAARDGIIPVSVAAKLVKLPEAEQKRIVTADKPDLARFARNEVKKFARDEKEQRLGARLLALPDKKYGVILCDVARRFNVRSRETGLDRAPDNHYPTMTFHETCDLAIPQVAADDCLLVFWSTSASLIDDIEILAEYGFITLRARDTNGKLVRDGAGNILPPPQQNYRSMQVWNKNGIGTGYWFRDTHEFVLVCARGKIVPPAKGTQDNSSFFAEKGEHSDKPFNVHEWIERLFPSLPRIELFARDVRPGWEVWGYEAPDGEPFDPDTGELPPAPASSAGPLKLEPIESCCARDRLDPDWIDEHGMVHFPDGHVVAADFVTKDEVTEVVRRDADKRSDERLDIPKFLRRVPQETPAGGLPANVET